MKKSVAAVVVFSLLLLALLPFSIHRKPEEGQVLVAQFHGWRASEGALTASRTERAEGGDTLLAAASDTWLEVTGTVGGTPCRILAPIAGGKFGAPVEREGNFTVQSVLFLNSYVRIVLESKTAPDIAYIDCYSLLPASEEIESYNQNWYGAFLPEAEVRQEWVHTPETPGGLTEVSYVSTVNVFEEEITERLTARIGSDGPKKVDPNAGADFKISLAAGESSTELTRADGTRKTLRGCGLILRDVKAYVTTPEGDYLSEITANFDGMIRGGGAIRVACRTARGPELPTADSPSPGGKAEFGSRQEIFPLSFSAEAESGMQARISWAGPGWHLEKKDRPGGIGDSCYARLGLKSNNAYLQPGQKELLIHWEYQAARRGDAVGKGLSDTFDDSLPYEPRI